MFMSLYPEHEIKPATAQAWAWFVKKIVKKVVFVDAMKAYGGLELPFHLFLTSVLDAEEWSASLHGRFTPAFIERGGGLPSRPRRFKK